MGLTGILSDGTRIEALDYCEFDGGIDASGQIGECGAEPRYRVRFSDGTAMHACEEHAQQLWDIDDAPPAVDAVAGEDDVL